MPDFPIRSLQFKDANNLNFTSIDTMSLLAIDSETRDFTKVAIDAVIENKITSDVILEGMQFIQKADKYFHIIKDYTSAELASLNTIDVNLSKINADPNTICAACSTTCISVSMEITGSVGCKACNTACVDGCNTNCGSVCAIACDTMCFGTCKGSATLVEDSAESYGG